MRQNRCIRAVRRAFAWNAHFPAFAVRARDAAHGRILLRSGSPASFPSNLIYGNLSKNPVNLSIFIEFFRNSSSPNAPERFLIIREFSLNPSMANAGNCGVKPDPEGSDCAFSVKQPLLLQSRETLIHQSGFTPHDQPSYRSLGFCCIPSLIGRVHPRPPLTLLPPRESITENIIHQAGVRAASRLLLGKENKDDSAYQSVFGRGMSGGCGGSRAFPVSGARHGKRSRFHQGILSPR